MKIFLLAENWPPRVGGIENYLTHIAKELTSFGNTVAAIVPNIGARGEGRGASRDGVTVIRKKFFWPLVKPAWLPFFITMYRLVQKEKPDLLICGKALFEGHVGYYLKKYLGIPYVVCTYAMEIEEWIKKPRTKKALERVLNHADRVLYINNITRKKLEGLGVQSDQLVRLQPGVDAKFFTPTLNNSVLKKYKLSQPYILTLARLVPRKGIDDVIEGFSRLDQMKFGNVTLVVVGEGAQATSLKQQARQLLLNDDDGQRVRFLEHVPDEDLPALYQQAELFILTPKNIEGDIEGFGIVYLEAAASGIAAIASRSGGAPEAVQDGATGLVVEASSPVEIKEALERLLEDVEYRQRLGERAQEIAKQEFLWKKKIRALHNVLTQVVSTK